MGDNLEGYVNYLKKIKGLSDKSIYHYLTYHRYFVDLDLTQKSINSFVQSKNNNPVCRAYLKSYLEFLKRDKEFDLPKTKTGSIKRRLIREVSKVEIKKMRERAYLERKKDGIIFDLIYYGALRRGEILTIKTHSFNWAKWFDDPENYCEFNVIGKRNKERKVVVHPKAVKSILEIYFDKGILTSHMRPIDIIEKLNAMDTLIFPKMNEWKVWAFIKKYSLKAFDRTVRPHEIRHARATELEESGASVRDIQRYLGHDNLATTEIYLHSDESKSLERIKTLSKTL